MRAPGGAGFRRRDALHAGAAARHFGPNMTPMVDIVMVILIFFMAGSAFIGPEWFLNVGVARGGGDAGEVKKETLDLPQTTSVIRMSRGGGETRVEGLGLKGAALGELEGKLREYATTGAAGAVKLVVEPTRDTPYQDVIRVYDLCQRSGFASVGLAKAR